MFLTWKNEHAPTTLDLRAVEAEIGEARDLFAAQPAGDAAGGMTLAAFAAWLGMDATDWFEMPGRLSAEEWGSCLAPAQSWRRPAASYSNPSERTSEG
jgi:hypothetical protein